MQVGQQERSLPEILQVYRTEAIALAVGVSRQRAHSWRTGSGFPGVEYLPKLADFLRIDLDALTRLVAQNKKMRAGTRRES